MSGKVIDISKANTNGEFLILVEFVELEYFKNELLNGHNFTINEASIVLAEVEVM